jgi:hypothetical protein
MLLRGCAVEMVLEFLRSDYRACCVATRRGRELARVIGDVYFFVLFNTVEAFALLYLGEWNEVQQIVDAALAITVRNVNPQAGALCRLTIGWLHAESQDFAAAAKCGEETLDATVEANPFTFFIGRTLLIRAYIGLRNLPLARVHLDAIDRRIADGIAMESLVSTQILLDRFEYWLAVGDFGRAREAAVQLHELTLPAPERTFLALSHVLMARVAIAAANLREARAHLSRAIAIVRNAQLPLAAWRVYATAANFHDGIGEVKKAARCRSRSGQVVRSLANSLEQGDPTRAAMFVARAAGR